MLKPTCVLGCGCVVVDNFIVALLNRKFYTVKNWYHFPTAREKLAPIRHIFRTNISHFVKNAQKVKFPPVACAAVRSKAVVLLLLTFCLLLLPLWESVTILCFVVCYFMSILVLQSS